MLDDDIDDYPGLDLSEFTPLDFAEIDSIVESHSNRLVDRTVSETSNADDGSTLVSPASPKLVDIGAEEYDIETILDVGVNGAIADVSFRSDDFDLNLNALSAEELTKLDEESLRQTIQHDFGPAIVIEIEEIEKQATSNGSVEEHSPTNDVEKPRKPKSPLDEFRSYMALSVTDLVSPAWQVIKLFGHEYSIKTGQRCEVQYDYGLRGKRHRPIGQRPASFVSSTGKTISPEVTTMKKNDVRTRQGLAVHKQLEREIKFEELNVEITTDETRWALRIVNMLACLRGCMAGYMREMPVFGILHDEVVIGIMDEVVKEEVSCSPNRSKKATKRPSTGASSPSRSKRPRTESSSVQTHIDALFESPKKSQSMGCGTSSPQKSVGYILHIKDNKTRKNHYLPKGPDMLSGRLQLMIYRRLLSELLQTNPPYDFTAIWRKVDVDPSAIFPIKFLVQAQLIQEFDGFQSACLNDLVNIWHEEVKALNILGVDPNLELVYRLRPPPGEMDNGKVVAKKAPPPAMISDEDRDLAKAIAASLEETSSDSSNSASTFSSEDMELQWALHQSSAESRPLSTEKDTVEKVLDKGKEKEKEDVKPTSTEEEEGIRRFKIIGTKKFLHNDEELDRYLDHVLQWWRGERKPEGVPLERVYRCSTCEYVNDCEWRAQKALELSKRKSSTSS